MFSSNFPFKEKSPGRYRCTHQTKAWLCICCLSGFFGHSTSFDDKWLPRTNGIHQTSRGKVIFTNGLNNLVRKPLNNTCHRMCS